jgi:hypothetical protein
MIVQGQETQGRKSRAISLTKRYRRASSLVADPEAGVSQSRHGGAIMRTLMSRATQSNQPLMLSCFLCNHAAMRF